jgi:predicted phosphodiesterase
LSLKIGLISDVHASPEPLQLALATLRQHDVEFILCAGDVAGYGSELDATVGLLLEYRCRVVLGNHDLWTIWESENNFDNQTYKYLRTLPVQDQLNVADTDLCMVHGSPPDSLMEGIKLLDEQGEIVPAQMAFWSEALGGCHCDVLIVGHTHQVFAEKLGETLVINPGSTVFNHTCAVVSLPEREVKFLALGDNLPVKSWHWGLFDK